VGTAGLCGLIEHTYDAALDPAKWPVWTAALERAVPFASLGLVFYEEQPASVIASTTVDESIVGQYMTHFYQHDLVTQRLLRSRGFDLFVDDDVIDDRHRTRSAFYTDYLGKMGLHRGLHAAPLRQDGQVAILGIHRTKAQGEFARDQVRLFQRLLPHLQRSLRVHQRMQSAKAAQSAAAQACDQAGIGIVTVKANGRIHFSNALAEPYLRGRGLTVSGGVIQGLKPDATRALHAAIADAVSPHGAVGQPVSLPLGPCGRKATIMVMPVRPGAHDCAEPMAMLILGKESAPSVEQGTLRATYGFTPAEARLLAALIGGERLPDYAARSGISPTTAKTHLKSLFDKTGKRRQADLIRLTLADPVLRMAAEAHTIN